MHILHWKINILLSRYVSSKKYTEYRNGTEEYLWKFQINEWRKFKSNLNTQEQTCYGSTRYQSRFGVLNISAKKKQANLWNSTFHLNYIHPIHRPLIQDERKVTKIHFEILLTLEQNKWVRGQEPLEALPVCELIPNIANLKVS